MMFQRSEPAGIRNSRASLIPRSALDFAHIVPVSVRGASLGMT